MPASRPSSRWVWLVALRVPLTTSKTWAWTTCQGSWGPKSRANDSRRDIAAHPTASRILSQLNGQMVRHQFRLSLVPGRPNVSLPEHLAIIDAVCARDAEAAQNAMMAHVGSVIATLQDQNAANQVGHSAIAT